jgi:predicted metal-dependent enzyme (double-stranded beta helix superfamily)
MVPGLSSNDFLLDSGQQQLRLGQIQYEITNTRSDRSRSRHSVRRPRPDADEHSTPWLTWTPAGDACRDAGRPMHASTRHSRGVQRVPATPYVTPHVAYHNVPGLICLLRRAERPSIWEMSASIGQDVAKKAKRC